jgi:opacity protein-like surface antigen
MKKRLWAAVATSWVAGLFLSGGAAAQGPYVEIGGGASFAGTLDIDDAKDAIEQFEEDLEFDFGPITIEEDEFFDFEPGHLGYLAAGYDIGAGLRIEAEGVVSHNALKTFGVTDTTALSFGAFANAVYAPDIGLVVRPYAAVGVGYLHSSFETEVFDEAEKADVGSFAWQVKAGAEYAVSPNVVVTGGYRFISSQIEYDEDDVELEGDLRTHAATIGLRFKTAR